MTQANRMTERVDILCDFGHDTHASFSHHVDLSLPHRYHDCAPIPDHLARFFDMELFNWRQYSDSPGVYCPGADVVSATIVEEGIWEAKETAVVLALLSSVEPTVVVDVGAQIGWFSCLAASFGYFVQAIDADPEPLRLLTITAERNGWDGGLIAPILHRFAADPATDDVVESTVLLPHIRLLKMDVEGAENHVVRAFMPAIAAGRVDFILAEISPIFDDYYPDLIADLIATGYEAYLIPPKRNPPFPLALFPDDLIPHRLDTTPPSVLREYVASWHQENVLFHHPSAPW